MKIKLALAIFGVGFSYALIILRSSLDTTSYENLGVQDERSVVIDVNLRSTDNTSMMQQLMTCMEALQQGNLNLTNMLLEHSKECVMDYSKLAGDHNFLIDALPSEKINELHETIKLMIGDVFEKTCCEVYCNWRRESLEECLFELEKIMMNVIRQSGPADQNIIHLSMRTLKVTLRMLFPCERQLCDRVFSGFSSIADFCFTEVCRGATVKLLNFFHDYASRDPFEFRFTSILPMLKTLGYLIPEFQSLFPESLVMEVVTVRDKLGEGCRDIFMKMEDDIFCSPYVDVIVRPDATDHPMTRFVMDYLVQILELFTQFANALGTSSVSDQIDRIMKRLERELVAMSKNYKYPALSHLFMMNNWRYIQQRAAKLGLDIDFFQNCAKIVQQNHELYQRSAWKMVLDFLKLENDELVDAESIKDNLINKHIEFICRHQSTWLTSKDLIVPIVHSEISLTITFDFEINFHLKPLLDERELWDMRKMVGE